MSRDKDLANLLPPTPPPRPDRRDATIEAAMRAYDSTGAPSPVAAKPSGPRPSWIGANRPLVGALASLAMVISIGLPVWMDSDFAPPTVETASPRRDSARTAGGTQMRERDLQPATVADRSVAPAHTGQPADEASQAAATPASRSEAQAPPPPPPLAAPENRVAPQSEAAFAFVPAVPPPPPPPAPPPPAPAAVVAAPPSARATRGDDIVVTGARATTEREDVAQSPTRKAFSRIALSDLNRCTVADPRRDIEACRTVIGEAVPTSARPFILDGVSRAWRGDLDGAIAALDLAVAQAPRSAFAYYNRGLVLSRRGATRRADADRERAIELDNRYRGALD